ncbi:Pectinesterase inhibitor domain [Macleaya cordata]|uniref:Pectinesterase inhibitor domain n=1 Tax=Macleaya cordata TaxID=56857 RepID=A0A200PWM0_MACCD|nr:Pectinesterase inhibitor domain [Macleaya cordata]
MDQHQPISVIFFLLALTFTHQVFAINFHVGAPNLAPTGDDLIVKTCSHAVYKELCVSTLRDDPDSQEADLAGLASIAIKIAMTNGSEIFNHIGQLLKAANYAPFTQQCLSDCSENYMDAVDQLEDSLAAIDAKGFNDVSTWVQAAMTDAESCEDGFKEEVGHQSLLTDRNAVFNQLCSNALALTNLLATM